MIELGNMTVTKEVSMQAVNKIIKAAKAESKCIWISPERIDSQLRDIRFVLDNRESLTLDQISELIALETKFATKNPGWQ